MPNATVEKANGTKYEVICVIVEELAQGGELFFYVKNSGYFTEKYARYFFHQIIDGLEYVHKTGYAHRDIKPDNILFDSEFNIKIADFGFAGPITGRTGSGYLETKLGTQPYQAPEINERKPYSGEAVDLFASAIVLFIMISGTPAFSSAEKQEFYYKLIVNKRFDHFWRFHTKGKPTGAAFFSDAFKDLMQKMFAYEPAERLTTNELKLHPWYNGEIPSKVEVLQELKKRKDINDEESERERKLKSDRKKGMTKRRGMGEEDEEEVQDSMELSKMIDMYSKGLGKQTEFFLPENPDEIMMLIEDYCINNGEDEEVKCEIDDKKYKAKIIYGKTNVELGVKIMRVSDEDYFCVECTRRGGDLIEFFNVYQELKLHVESKLGYAEIQNE